jgi:hypothetical protein
VHHREFTDPDAIKMQEEEKRRLLPSLQFCSVKTGFQGRQQQQHCEWAISFPRLTIYSKAVLTEEKRELSSDEVFRVQVLGTSIMAEDLQQLEQCIIVSASPFTLSSPDHLLTHRTNKKRFFVFQNKFVLTMSSRSSLPASHLSFAVTESCGLLSQTMMQCLFRST